MVIENVCISQNYEHQGQKRCRYPQHVFLLHAHCPKNLAKSFEAISQFSRLMQYFTFGVSISPCINPASFSSFKCWETVALAMGNSSWMSPKKQHSCFARNSRIAILAGCPMALANRAICSCSAVYSLFIFLFYSNCSQIYEQCAKMQNILPLFLLLQLLLRNQALISRLFPPCLGAVPVSLLVHPRLFPCLATV